MSWTRREFLASSVASAAATCAGPLLGAAESRPPNLLFILADQWRGSAFGIGSDEAVRTPQIDRFTGQGAHWQRAYAANPVCTPNRSCILTGRFSHQHGMIQNNLMLPPEEICWPEIFHSAGYATHYIGKWHMDGAEKPGYVPPGWRRRGFTTFEGFNRGHVYHKEYGFDDAGAPLFAKWNARGRTYYEPAFQTDLAIDFMRGQGSRPFCCYLSWGPPHTPFQPPRDFDRYQASDIRLRPNVPQEHRAQAIKDLTGYYGLCESLDYEFGRLMEFLDQAGLADNTVVVFTADHGELAGSHGKYRKGEPEEESLNIPMMMRWPGKIPSGLQCRTLISSIDLMPTMLSLCGLPVPARCTGRDLSAALLPGQTAPRVESLYAEGKLTSADDGEDGPSRRQQARNASSNTWRTLVTDRYKLTLRAEENRVEAMVDLQNDPFERENLANLPAQRSLQDDLLAELRRWGRETGDVFPQQPAAAKALYSDAEAEAARARG